MFLDELKYFQQILQITVLTDLIMVNDFVIMRNGIFPTYC